MCYYELTNGELHPWGISSNFFHLVSHFDKCSTMCYYELTNGELNFLGNFIQLFSFGLTF
jgi:hypothetical protein